MSTTSDPVWVCLPTYNERENIERMIVALLDVFNSAQINGTILVIDDNSPDGTGELADAWAAKEPRVKVLHRTGKEGLGRAYLAGFQEALEGGAELVMEMDCDFSHDPADVPRLIAGAANADLVLGSRNIPGGGVENWPLLRRLISKWGSFYARKVLSLQVRDLTGGFKCFHREVLESLDLGSVSAQGYMFQIDLTWRSVLAGFKVKEVPITFIDREFGESKMSGAIVFEAVWRVWALRFSTRKVLRRLR